jgi:hypothetical protein
MMFKRLLPVCCTLLLCLGIGWADLGFSPQTYKNQLQYGTGVFFAPPKFTLYPQPDETTEPLDVLEWSPTAQSLMVQSLKQHRNLPAERYFISYYPKNQVAMMAVLSENGEGWAEVAYDQRTDTPKTAWVRLQDPPAPNSPLHLGRFQSWYEFMTLNAKQHGVYWLTGTPESSRALRSAPEDMAKLIPLTLVRKLTVKHIRGNWMLVEVVDFDRTAPIGWMRWRDEDGRLTVFTRLEHQAHQAFMMP